MKDEVLARMQAREKDVWTPVDFVDLAGRGAVDKVLQRLVKAGVIRRIERGLYDYPRTNTLTGRPRVPDYRAVIAAVARRDQARTVIDGMTAANELGLTTALPAKIEVLVDARLRPITLGKQVIRFRQAAPSRLYWAGRPAMRVVQALHWMKDTMQTEQDKEVVLSRLALHLAHPSKGKELQDDLRNGIHAMPTWMQALVVRLIRKHEEGAAQ